MSLPAKPAVVACPICSAAVSRTTENRWKPFCSERCKLIDLGDWIDERHRIPGDETDASDEDIRD
jgi:endogenous inhibitor of DNA gyrase (YacG/DUF329 family)